MAGGKRGNCEPLVVASQQLAANGFDAFVTTLCGRVMDSSSRYEGIPDAAGFRAGVAATARLYCLTLTEGRAVRPAELSRLHIIGAQRAGEGMMLSEVVDAALAGVDAGWDCLTEAIAEAAPVPEEARRATNAAFPLTRRFAEDITTALQSGYQSQHDDGLPGHLRAQATVVDRLLEGDEWTEREVAEYSSTHGIRVKAPCGLIVVTYDPAPRDAGTLRHAARDLTAALPTAVAGRPRTIQTTHLALLVPAASDRWSRSIAAASAVAEKWGVTIVLVEPVAALCEIRTAYESVRQRLHLCATARPTGGVLPDLELRLYGLLDAIPTHERMAFSLHVLAGLETRGTRKRAESLQLLQALVAAAWNTSVAAAQLDTPLTTLRYRLARTGEALALDPSDAFHRLCVELAVRLHGGWGARLDEGDPPRWPEERKR